MLSRFSLRRRTINCKVLQVAPKSSSIWLRHHFQPLFFGHSASFHLTTNAQKLSNTEKMKEKERLVIVGSGWAGTTLATEIDENKYAVSVISPESSLSYTPLLASAACGLYDFSLVQQPIRHASRHTRIYKAAVQNIDFKAKSLQCKAAFAKHANDEFRMDYDILILAPGVSTK